MNLSDENKYYYEKTHIILDVVCGYECRCAE